MKIFESARIRLTVWYLVIIAFVSLSFSLIIYRDITVELTNGYQRSETRLMAAATFPLEHRKAVLSLLYDDLLEAKRLVLFRLLAINGIILGVAGVGGYFLAGQTLYPIRLMVDEQKRFVADASHEFKTPLTALKTEMEVALRDKKLNLKDAKKLIQSNLEEINKMQEFTSYLLSLNRLETNGNGNQKEAADFVEIVRRGVEKNLIMARKNKVRITQNYSDVEVKANVQNLIELVSILVNNAIKYSPKGSEVKVMVKKEGRCALLTVADCGVGIAKSDLPHIFERFYRADTSRSKKNVEGYGLGLSIAKSIVDQHKGTIKVTSESKLGTTFKVTLPAV